MSNPRNPREWLLKGLSFSIGGLFVASLGVWATSSDVGPAPKKFQGGIADPYKYQSPSPEQSPIATPEDNEARSKRQGTMIISVTDQNDLGARNIAIEVDGPRSMTLKTDEKGEARLVAPAGYYTLRIKPGCTQDLDLGAGASARVGIAEGKTGSGSMRVIWRHRYRPWHPAFSSRTPFWPMDEVIDVRFYVADRCESMQRAPNAAFPSFRLRPSSNLEIVEQSSTSDGSGHGLVKVRCLEPGAVSLVSYDSENPDDDQLDLLLEDVTNAGPPDCRGSS